MLKKFILACLITCGLSLPAAAQYSPYLAQYIWKPVTTTGPLGAANTDQYLNLTSRDKWVPSIHTISFYVSGTAPSACTFRVEGTVDFVNWQALDVTPPATESCTASGMFHIADKPVRGIRINVISYTPGDATTSVIFSYAGSN